MGTLVLLESNTTGTGRLFARAAVHLGHEPVLLAADPARYPYAADDGIRTEVIDTGDERAVLEACRRLGEVVGVTSSSEYFIAPAARVAAALGLPGPDADAITRCRDKERQREALAAASVAVPRFAGASTVDDALAAAADIGYPVVLKPVAGSGSVGVRLCRDKEEAAEHAGALLAHTVNERGIPVPARLLVEEVATGTEYSAEVFSGRVVGLVRKHLGDPPWFVEVGHDFPAPDDGLTAAVDRAVAALGLGFGPVHVELKANGVIIEVNPRLAGGNIPELVRHASGVDLVTESVRLVVGGLPHLDAIRRRHAAIRFLLPPTAGTLEAVHGLQEAAAVDGVVEVRVTKQPGDAVSRNGDFRDRIGHVLAVADDGERARAAAEEARGRIVVEVAD
ncbi:MAG TPA: ATP-grasp domain-containing protein [Acidimicrobiales bacterium]|nr:ATP-grasp domain-containing protein [Acidimicrobiales bacterium]